MKTRFVRSLKWILGVGAFVGLCVPVNRAMDSSRPAAAATPQVAASGAVGKAVTALKRFKWIVVGGSAALVLLGAGSYGFHVVATCAVVNLLSESRLTLSA